MDRRHQSGNSQGEDNIVLDRFIHCRLELYLSESIN